MLAYFMPFFLPDFWITMGANPLTRLIPRLSESEDMKETRLSRFISLILRVEVLLHVRVDIFGMLPLPGRKLVCPPVYFVLYFISMSMNGAVYTQWQCKNIVGFVCNIT